MTVWKTATIGSVCTTFSGGTPSTSHPEYYGGDIAWIASADLNQGRIRSVKGRITRVGLERSSAKLVKSGTPLIALYGATAGVPAITYVDGAINQAILAMIPRAIESEYFFQWLQANRESIIDRYTQGGQPNLSGAIVRNIEIPLPPVSEQRRIGEVLGNADNLIAELERLITKKQAIKQGMMQELLTGRARLPGFVQPWSTRPFGEVLTRLNVKKYQVPASSYGAVGSVPVVDQGQQAIVGYTDNLAATFRPGPGGVIVFGDHTCITKFVDFAFAVGADGTQVVKATGSNVTQFFAYVLEHDPIASTGYNRHFGFLRERTFVIPPLDEQLAIVTVLADVDAEIKALITRLAKTRDIKQGMMQELLTGRTRLPIQEAVA